ncbi:hypothetical protein QBC34DRAFT_389132 [Podospora aff. communis PSN243]|uniref:Uncharacterized protein n=1 Tax=Podospora aff. communis PSN243 TaxID=3040156 RepID=A0AAV9H8C1_9PEZI|nr:hypothetical protein QBC34DRAFT_389132 [Podospora aff. communis PSN243]
MLTVRIKSGSRQWLGRPPEGTTTTPPWEMDCWLVWIQNKVIKRPSKTDRPAFVIARASILRPRGTLSISNGATSASSSVCRRRQGKKSPPFPLGCWFWDRITTLCRVRTLKWGHSDKGERQRSTGYDNRSAASGQRRGSPLAVQVRRAGIVRASRFRCTFVLLDLLLGAGQRSRDGRRMRWSSALISDPTNRFVGKSCQGWHRPP